MTEAYQAPSGAEHPITPPPELVEQWHVEAMKGFRTNGVYEQDIATQAARWGADQELEAVCDEILHCVAGIYEDTVSDWSELVDLLRDSRRPKPPSLKEQALEALTKIEDNEATYLDSSVIRRALEQLDD